MSRSRASLGFILAAAAALAVAVALLSADSPPRALSRESPADAAAETCPREAGVARVARAELAALARYRLESRGPAVHADLHRIARDPALLHALAADSLRRALLAAEHQLVNHVVRIRVLRGARVLVDANASSFDVAGASVALPSGHGSRRERLEITVQDFIGYVKLMHKINHVDVLVRGSAGHTHSSLALAANVDLPTSGCTSIAGRRYAVRTLAEVGFAGEPVTITLLSALRGRRRSGARPR
jgi:hypothetical protein